MTAAPSPSPAADDPIVGSLVGDFRIVAALGSGGIGVVYEGWNSGGGRAAIKVLRRELGLDAAYLGRLTAQTRALAKLRHPGIVEVLTVGKLDSGSPYLVMECLDGETLAAWARRSAPVSIDDVVGLGAQLCNALQAAHAQGVVHEALKIENLFVAHVNGKPELKLADFGLARASRGAGPQMTATLAVMSPEQIRSETPTPQTDLYAVGAVLYRLLTGADPFTASSPADLLKQHLRQPPPDPRALRPETPTELAILLQQLLAKDRADRPQSAEQVERALQSLPRSASKVAAPVPPSAPLAAAPAEPELFKAPEPAEPGEGDEQGAAPRRWRWAIGAVVVASLVVTAAGLSRRQPPKAPPPARVVAPVIASPEAAKPAPPASPVAKTAAPPTAAPLTAKLLLARADALMNQLKQKPSITYNARVELRRLRRRVEATPDATELSAVADELDVWERIYLR